MHPGDYNDLDEEKKQILLQAMMAIPDRKLPTLDEKIAGMAPAFNDPFDGESVWDEREQKYYAKDEAGPITILLTASVPRGYVRDMKTGTLYKLETWLQRIERGLASWEHGEKGQG